MSKIQKQRDLFNLAFDELGGLDKLVQWANDTDTKGNSNYGEFLKLFVKLTPPIKEQKNATDNHESFILTIINEQKKLDSQKDKPVKLVETTAIESKSQ
jgi:hypothetical protein